MGQERRHPNVVGLDEVETHEMKQGDFVHKTRRLAAAAGGRALGCSHYEIPPGKTTFPFHFHSGLEEAIYVLEGEGTLRIGKSEVAIGRGDYIALPPGPDHAHALSNRGSGPLRYLCVSGNATPLTLDIVGYPDSKKLAMYAGVDRTRGMRHDQGWIFKILKDDRPDAGYFDDEPLAHK
jgi:uncharacterized cupin superfamily protein